MLLEAALGILRPYTFLAATLNVYVCPVVNPVTVIGEEVLEANLAPQDPKAW
jgi:hypothetical protein